MTSNRGSEQINAALVVVEEAFKTLGWNMTPVHILREALVDKETQRHDRESG